ncbi:MAG: OmpA family protein [Candidatus Omnitrophica bacterium]|nr:OmpA family protein [Candidatus Omnitrophota bacterium]
MKSFLKTSVKLFFIGCMAILLSGCTVVLQKRTASDIEQIGSLSEELQRLKMTEDELLKLKEAYAALEKGLSKEIGEDKVTLGIEQKGLVITFVDSVLFDSGKAKLRSEASKSLDKVAGVCRRVVADREVGIEGHTDNQPIKYSGWKSNWELSIARATSVLHYLTKKGISPERLSATGFGEYRPVATNKTVKDRQKNRRVEIVILPEKIVRVKKTPQGKYVK